VGVSNRLGMKKFLDYQPNQGMLMPAYLSDWLPADHEIHFISEAVDQLDLSAIERAYSGGGRPAYDPRMMVKVLFYAYRLGVRSSRQIERLLYENIPMRVLAGNQQPDHWTINQFRRRHQEALAQLFKQTVLLAAHAGLVGLSHVAIDGTKVKANASRHSAMSYGRMEEAERRLEAEIQAYLKGAAEEDVREDQELGDRRGNELPPQLKEAKKRLEAIRKAKGQLEAEARAKEEERRAAAEREGKRPRRPQGEGKPKARTQYNFTDPDSRIMKASDGFVQGYNAQLAVDAKAQIIVAADLTNRAADAPHLPGVVEQIQANCGSLPREMSADAGYYSEANVLELERRGIEGFIPPEKIRHMHWRTAKAPRGRIPKNLDRRGRMMRKLSTKRGKARYKLRQTTVEPVIGQMKWNRNFRQLLRRGLTAARLSWLFECAVHNLLKVASAMRARKLAIA